MLDCYLLLPFQNADSFDYLHRFCYVFRHNSIFRYIAKFIYLEKPKYPTFSNEGRTFQSPKCIIEIELEIEI